MCLIWHTKHPAHQFTTWAVCVTTHTSTQVTINYSTKHTRKQWRGSNSLNTKYVCIGFSMFQLFPIPSHQVIWSNHCLLRSQSFIASVIPGIHNFLGLPLLLFFLMDSTIIYFLEAYLHPSTKEVREIPSGLILTQGKNPYLYFLMGDIRATLYMINTGGHWMNPGIRTLSLPSANGLLGGQIGG